MATVSDVWEALQPDLERIRRSRCSKENDTDRKIIEFAKKVKKSLGTFETLQQENTLFENYRLSKRLKLLDLKTAAQCQPLVQEKLISCLALEHTIEIVNQKAFSFLNVHDDLLRTMSLFEFQKIGSEYDLYRSPLWYTLAPTEQFLNRPIRDLKGIQLNGVIAAERVQLIEEMDPQLLQKIEKPSVEKINDLGIAIGEFHLFSGQELSDLAETLSPESCRLFSFEQIYAADFEKFTGEQLDSMIAGPSREDRYKNLIRAKLSLLPPMHVEIYLQKSSGKYFHLFSDEFYSTLRLSEFTVERIAQFFKVDSGNDNYDLAQKSLQLVAPEEIKKGFHLLPERLLPLLRPHQIAALDFSTIESGSLRRIFSLSDSLSGISREEKAYFLELRILAIPSDAVNEVIRKCPEFISLLTNFQCRALDTSLLKKESVRRLFPAFTVESLYEGCSHEKTIGWKQVYHIFSRSGFKERIEEKVLYSELACNKEKCRESARKFTSEQIEAMQPLMFPEAVEFFRNYHPSSEEPYHKCHWEWMLKI